MLKSAQQNSDIEEYTTREHYQVSRNTVADYLNVLVNIHLIKNQPPYAENIRSSIRIGKTPKRHFVDPSLASAVLEAIESVIARGGEWGCEKLDGECENSREIGKRMQKKRLWHVIIGT